MRSWHRFWRHNPAFVLALCGCLGSSTPSVSLGADKDATDDIHSETQALACQAEPGEARLLTREEYNTVVAELLGDTSAPARVLPSENKVAGFENNASSHQVNPNYVRSLMELAEVLSTRALAQQRSHVLPCEPGPSLTAEQCAQRFIETFARKAFRGAVSTEASAALLEVFRAGAADGSFDAGISQVIEVVLQSPNFLYRLEGEADASDGAARARIAPAEMASRLSFLLWGAGPDDELLDAAANGRLSESSDIEAQAQRMLSSPRTRARVASFHRQWLHTDLLDGLAKDAATFPGYIPSMQRAWRESLDRYVDDAFWSGGTLSSLLSSNTTFVDATLAPLYNVSPPAAGTFVPVSLPANERSGLLTQPAMLSMLAQPDQSSPILRGVFVREKFLCQPLPPPPANVVIEAPSPDPNATTRERYSQHSANAACAGCHRLMDPVGFAFENFDGMGRYRTTENNLPIDASGEFLGVNDPALSGAFVGAQALSSRLANSRTVSDCVALQWWRFAMGRIETKNDTCNLKKAQDAFAQSGGRFDALLLAIVRTPAFRYREVTP